MLPVKYRVSIEFGGEGGRDMDAVVLPFVENIDRGQGPQATGHLAFLFPKLAHGGLPGRFVGLHLATYHPPGPGIGYIGGPVQQQKFHPASFNDAVWININDTHSNIWHRSGL